MARHSRNTSGWPPSGTITASRSNTSGMTCASTELRELAARGLVPDEDHGQPLRSPATRPGESGRRETDRDDRREGRSRPALRGRPSSATSRSRPTCPSSRSRIARSSARRCRSRSATSAPAKLLEIAARVAEQERRYDDFEVKVHGRYKAVNPDLSQWDPRAEESWEDRSIVRGDLAYHTSDRKQATTTGWQPLRYQAEAFDGGWSRKLWGADPRNPQRPRP